MIRKFLGFARNLAAHTRGNVLMIFAFAVIPMVFATGMGIDYARAARLKTKLNAIADAAALAAVSQPQMNNPSDDDAKAIAKKMFNAQAQGLEGLDGAPTVSIDVTHPDGATSRVVKVSYTASSINMFGAVLHMRTIPIGGMSSATATAAPNMDFYIALDTSPSMALPTTSAGIETMDDAVQCSFACHSNKIEQYAPPISYNPSIPTLILNNTHFFDAAQPDLGRSGWGNNQIQKIDSDGTYIYVDRSSSADSSTVQKQCSSNGKSSGKNICIYNKDGSFVDSYWYALNQGLSLRVTDERNAVKDLMALAKSYADLNKRVYRAGIYTFDYKARTILPVPNPNATPLQSNLEAVSAAANNIDLVTVNDKQSNGCPPSPDCTGSNRYLFTSFKSMLNLMDSALPAQSGQGSNEPGDTPQAYLFIVTDGMSDEDIGKGRTRAPMQQQQVDQCNAIKAAPRNVKIAILYTEYTVASIQDDEPNQREMARKAIEDDPTIAKRLSDCASPGLMYTVRTDESISAALQALFAKAIANARLNQ
jgi:Flp pilus assembly protein TadG